ncbi:hypothetical protein [Deinococcus sp. UYEF24]
MSFFKKIFGRAPEPEPTAAPLPGRAPTETPTGTSLAVLFDRLPESLSEMAREFSSRLPALGAVDLGRQTPDEPTFPAMMEVGGHSVWALGFDLPMPEEAQQRSIFYSNWNDEAKAPLYAHRAHVLLFYQGGSEDPVVQLSVLYALAAGMHPLGVADETAFNCVPAAVLQEASSAEFLQAAQTDIPSLLWTGILKFHREDGQTWYVTRGFGRFGKPNLAFLAPTGHGEQATDQFHTLLNYQHFYKQTFAHGHTAELGGQFLRFADPYEYAEYLSGGQPVLTVSVDS